MLRLLLRTYLVRSNALFNADWEKILVDVLVKAVLWIRASDQWIQIWILVSSRRQQKTIFSNVSLPVNF
jgi:hypothetical protein